MNCPVYNDPAVMEPAKYAKEFLRLVKKMTSSFMTGGFAGEGGSRSRGFFDKDFSGFYAFFKV